ncbi:MAG: chemotactic signal-response protein cheL [Rhodospirillaceae bacterium]|nr:MAG: chemotactic signal-response protein cheL [Rhodospirillaceae bacterium]
MRTGDAGHDHARAPSVGGGSTAGAQAAAKKFEAMFVAEMLKPMFENLPTDGLFGGGHGEAMMRSMLVDEYGKRIVEHGGLGLSDQITKTMLQMQEAQKMREESAP